MVAGEIQRQNHTHCRGKLGDHLRNVFISMNKMNVYVTGGPLVSGRKEKKNKKNKNSNNIHSSVIYVGSKIEHSKVDTNNRGNEAMAVI